MAVNMPPNDTLPALDDQEYVSIPDRLVASDEMSVTSARYDVPNPAVSAQLESHSYRGLSPMLSDEATSRLPG
jgi:hypothetical protein